MGSDRYGRKMGIRETEFQMKVGNIAGFTEADMLDIKKILMFRHILRNALIPIVTGVVAVLPLLFMGSLLLESFFAIPGLGSYTIDAINNQDFAIVRAMVFLGSVLYIFGLILVDITYTLVDPRVRLT